MQQIHSETQRLVRDSPVSLPYHRPRQRTLVEFIQRGKLKSANRQLKPSLSVPTKKLNKVWKHLEEREKEAEGFYKAESEDSEKEYETPKHEESQNQPIAAAECVVQCTQTPGIPLAEVEEEGSPQREVKNLDIYCDAAVINADAEKRECSGEISEVTKDRTGINVEINDTLLNDIKVDISGKTKSAMNDVSDICFEDAETQFYLISRQTNSSENEKGFTSSNETNQNKVQIDTHETVHSQSSGTDINFHHKEVHSFENVLQNNLKKTNIDVEPLIEVTSVRTIDIQEFMLIGSNPELTNTVFSCEQMESKEKITVSNEGTSASNHAVDIAHSSTNNFFIGSYTQNFHLHYSESISLDNNNEDANKTGKCILGSEVDREDSLDISLGRKGNSLIKEPTEIKDSKDNSKKEKIDSYQEDEKSNAEWWRNIKPLSDDSDNEERLTENRKVLSIEKHRFRSLESIDKLQPRLSDAPSGIIDLDEDVAEKGGVTKFLQRIMKHSAAGVKSKPTRRTKEISVVSAEKNIEGLETVQKDVMTVTLGDDDPVEDPALKKPGAKLQRLKEELQQQMAQKRAEEWQKRQQEQILDNEELGEVGELSDCGAKEEEIEEEMTDEVTDSTTEMEDEDDVPVVEKKRKRSSFIDEEAITNNEEIDKDVKSSEPSTSKKQKLERVKTFDLFASEDETTQEIQELVPGDQDLELTSSLIPAYQLVRDGAATPWRSKEDETKKSVFELISPASDLTPWRSRSNLQSESPTPLTVDTISSCDRSSIITQQTPKRLFNDSEHISTQEHMNELLDLCSGKFSLSAPDSEVGVRDELKQVMEPAEGNKDELEQELLGLCSGKFTTIHRHEQLAPSPVISEKMSWRKAVVVSSDEEDERENLKNKSQRKGVYKKLTYSGNTDEMDLARKDSDDDVSDGDEEHEAEWRRRRDEREAFLQKQKATKRCSSESLPPLEKRLKVNNKKSKGNSS